MTLGCSSSRAHIAPKAGSESPVAYASTRLLHLEVPMEQYGRRIQGICRGAAPTPFWSLPVWSYYRGPSGQPVHWWLSYPIDRRSSGYDCNSWSEMSTPFHDLFVGNNDFTLWLYYPLAVGWQGYDLAAVGLGCMPFLLVQSEPIALVFRAYRYWKRALENISCLCATCIPC